MLLIVEEQVTNELAPYPEFITEYRVVTDDGKIILETRSEDKAYAMQHQLSGRADLRDL